MSKFDDQYRQQGGRCFWCQYLTPASEMTRDHLHPKKGGQRTRLGGDWVLACAVCNRARGALTIGSLRFERWLRRITLHDDVRPFVRRDAFLHNPT